eukprot:2134694-Rhodomonas_salina.3
MSHHTSKVNEGNVQSTGGDIDTSSPEVDAAIQAVRTPGSETRWAVLGYEGNTGKLKAICPPLCPNGSAIKLRLMCFGVCSWWKQVTGPWKI